MTDQNRVNWILQAFFTGSSLVTFTPGTSGGSALNIHPPYNLRLMSAVGSNTANGTELTGTNGYTSLGNSLGASAFGTPAAGVQSNNNLVSWSASGAWSNVVGIEIWDTSATPLRWLQGGITSITGVVNGDTVQFAIASISINSSLW